MEFGFSKLQDVAAVARYRLKRYLGAHPSLFFPIFRRRANYPDKLVDSNTDICIEGFPRSANSFAVGALQHAQSDNVNVAHHTHQPASVMRACQQSVPVMVLIRKPADAVISLQALSLETMVLDGKQPSIDDLQVGFADHLRRYILFYESIQPYKKRFVTGSFEQVTQDYAAVIDRVNNRFSTKFDLFDQTKENIRRVNKSRGRGNHAGPTDRRDKIKTRIREDFERRIANRPSLGSLLSNARALYEQF